MEQQQQQDQKRQEQAMASRLDAIRQCAQWIAELADTGGGVSCPFDSTATIEFRHSTVSNNIGVFAKKDINKDEVLLRLPQDAVLRESHPALQSSPAILSLVDKMMNAHDAFVEAQAESISSKDLFYPNNGRILGRRDVHMIAIVTIILLLFYATDSSSLDASTAAGTTTLDASSARLDDAAAAALLSAEVKKLVTFWCAFFNTWPKNFSNLPMFWTEAEMDTIRGTSYHAYVSRLRQNVNELWRFCHSTSSFFEPSRHWCK